MNFDNHLCKAYSSLDNKFKIIIMVGLILVFFGISTFTAIAASGISFNGQTPVSGSATRDPTPNISIDATVLEGQVTIDDIRMYLGSELVTPTLTNSSGVHTISHTPTTKLIDCQHTVTVDVFDDSLQDYKSTSWSFNVDAAPKASNLTPSDGSMIETASPKISAYIKDTYDNLDENSLSLKIDGTSVTPKFTFKGHWETDSCTGCSYYVIDSYQEGTMEYQSSNLSDGIHTIELSMSDANGNKLVETWSFTVVTKPNFLDFTPANGSEQQSVSTVSVKVTDDNGSIDPENIILKNNGNQVSHSFDSETGIISYSGTLSYGNHDMTVSATDISGNTGTATWSFIVDNQPPSAQVNLTYFQEGMVISDGKLEFKVHLSDLVDIKNNVTLSLDGNPLNIDFKYAGYYDYWGNWIISSKKEADVSYTGTISDGSHTLSLYSKDILGNSIAQNWNFSVATYPEITGLSPIQYGIQDLTPTISATLKDLNGTIESISLQLNGETVIHNYDTANYKVTYTPTEPLTNEQYHTVTITAVDDAGLSTTKTWKFYTNTYLDMPDSNYINCTACHIINDTNPLEDTNIHKVNFGGTHTYNDCNICHGYISYSAGCVQCHSVDGAEYAPHGSTPTITYQPKNYDTNFPIRITTNREMFDCIVCHQPGTQVLRKSGYSINNHDIPELHKVKDSECSSCHALSLTREHARDGRLDNNNQTINCNTCHKSTDTNVLTAVTNKVKSCAACHENADHDSVHSTSLDSTCQSCHKLTLTEDHSSRSDDSGNYYSCDTCHKSNDSNVQTAITNKDKSCESCHKNPDHQSMHKTPLDNNCQTCHKATLTEDHLTRTDEQGKSYTCDTCHSSGSTKTTRTIKSNIRDCGGCHQSGHNNNFGSTISADIPFYPNFQWTHPIEASIYSSKSTIPAGYESGQVVISNRRTDVTTSQVWDFYNNQLTANGWALSSDQPVAGSNIFIAEFTKDGRFVTIKCFNTLSSDGTGGLIKTGFRVELWFK